MEGAGANGLLASEAPASGEASEEAGANTAGGCTGRASASAAESAVSNAKREGASFIVSRLRAG
jgi:hypothetical protein